MDQGGRVNRRTQRSASYQGYPGQPYGGGAGTGGYAPGNEPYRPQQAYPPQATGSYQPGSASPAQATGSYQPGSVSPAQAAGGYQPGGASPSGQMYRPGSSAPAGQPSGGSQPAPLPPTSTNSADDRDTARRYFEVVNNKILIIICAAGLLLTIMGIANSRYMGGMIVLGLILLGISGFILYRRFTKKVTDEMYDAIVDRVLKGQNVEKRALSILGLDPTEVSEVRPIVIDGYDYVNATQVKLGKDQKWRSNMYSVTMLYFCRAELYTYKFRFCVTDDRTWDSSDMYFYDDIVSVSTASETLKINGGRDKIDSSAIKLTTSGGTTFSASIRNVAGAQRSFDAMRAYLKDRKRSARR